jgi:hypothetical protein
MFKVYWTDQSGTVFGQEYEDMTVALNLTQVLRNEGCYQFICMVSENPNNMTKMGVDETDAGYTWKKRRT